MLFHALLATGARSPLRNLSKRRELNIKLDATQRSTEFEVGCTSKPLVDLKHTRPARPPRTAMERNLRSYPLKTEQKLSEILVSLTDLLLIRPGKTKSSEAANAAMLFARLGWNRALGQPTPDFTKLLLKLKKSNPSLWDDLISNNPEELISRIQIEKQERYSSDRRIILISSATPSGNLRVQWCYIENLPEAKRYIDRLIENPPSSWGKLES